jgi:hypothetical protein
MSNAYRWDKPTEQWYVAVDTLPEEYNERGYPAHWVKIRNEEGRAVRYVPLKVAITMIEQDTDSWWDVAGGEDPRPAVLEWLRQARRELASPTP